MDTTIELGLHAFPGYGRAKLRAYIKLELKTIELGRHYDTLKTITNVPVFSASGGKWDRKQADLVHGGQMIDYRAERIKTPQVQRICQIWEQYHLNDMTAGTKAQTEAIEEWEAAGNKYDYTEACKYLNDIGLRVDRGYEYGSEWLCKPIPADIIAEIEKIIEENELRV